MCTKRICPCDAGEEFERNIQKCIPVTCESKNACDGDDICVSETRICAKAPCPQFYCRPRDSSCQLKDGRIIPHWAVIQPDPDSSNWCNHCRCYLGKIACTQKLCLPRPCRKLPCCTKTETCTDAKPSQPRPLLPADKDVIRISQLQSEFKIESAFHISRNLELASGFVDRFGGQDLGELITDDSTVMNRFTGQDLGELINDDETSSVEIQYGRLELEHDELPDGCICPAIYDPGKFIVS